MNKRMIVLVTVAALMLGLMAPQALAAAEGKGKAAEQAQQGESLKGDKAQAESETLVDDEQAADEAEATAEEKGSKKPDKGEKPVKSETAAEDETATEDETAAEDETKAKAEKVEKVKQASIEAAKAERMNGENGAYLIYVNGERLNLTPLTRSGRTLVPFRRLAESLGAAVEWEPESSTVVVTAEGVTVRLTIGSTTALVNGEEVPLEVPAELVDGSTFVPVRFLGATLGAEVDYDPETGAITVIRLLGQWAEEATEDEATEDEATEDEATEDEAAEQQ